MVVLFMGIVGTVWYDGMIAVVADDHVCSFPYQRRSVTQAGRGSGLMHHQAMAIQYEYCPCGQPPMRRASGYPFGNCRGCLAHYRIPIQLKRW